MPPDGGLGRGFERAASGIDVDVRESFLSVARIARRKRAARRSLFVALAVVVIAGAAVGGFVARTYFQVQDKPAIAPVPHVSTTPVGLGHEAYGRVAGTYVTTVPRGGSLVSSYRLAGRWQMTLNRNGSVAFAAPFGYVHHIGPPAMSSYSLSGTTFMTDALLHEGYGCTSSGVYRWHLSGGTLTFTLLKDDCPYRPAVFASTAWKRR